MTETATRMAPSSNTEAEPIPEIEGRLYITQSPFYSPAFNGAIFDGPLRLYFSQSQEALALKFYFELRSKTQDLSDLWPRTGGPSLYVMIYPTEETFDLCFVSQGLAWTPETLPMGRLGRDHVVALQAGECENELSPIVDKVVNAINGISPKKLRPVV
ncbi:hypothetical protein BH10BDE1_BH10BDE1_27040 [soil metagenome]